MKKLIIGTMNQAKVDQIKAVLVPLGIEVVGLPKNVILPEVVEDQMTAQGNARKKAVLYSKALGDIVFSMDNALYFDGLTSQNQPGLNVRRVPGYTGRPSDTDLLEYYTKVISELGGRTGGHWEFAICVSGPKGILGETLIKSPRVFVSKKSEKVVDGYPLESIQIDPQSGRYISEMSSQEQGEFWQKMIGKEIADFIAKINL